MKKVWILEWYVGREKLEEMVAEGEEMVRLTHTEGNEFNTPETQATAERYRDILAKKLEDNPDGYWDGLEGKTGYRAFCDVARDAIRRHRGEGRRFRVIEGTIEDGAKTWLGYETVKENAGVLRYLYATA